MKAGWIVAKDRAVKRGAHIGRTPFGYVRVPKGEPNSGVLVPHPERAPAVLAAFKARNEGASYSDIARSLDRLAPKERHWTIVDVKRMLRSRVYLGEVRYGDALVNHEAHEPIVTPGLFAAVQRTLTSGRVTRTDTPFLLSGLLRCANCRYAMGGFSRGGTNRATPVYRCLSRGKRCDHRPLVTASILDRYVVSVFRDQLADARGKVADTHEHAPDLTALDSEVDALSREVDDWITDVGLKRRLGAERWQQGLDARLDVHEAKQHKRDEAHQRHARASALSVTFDPDTLDAATLRDVLPHAIKYVFVRAGRGQPIDRRTLIVLADGPDFETPRRGRPGPFPPLPWSENEDPTVLAT